MVEVCALVAAAGELAAARWAYQRAQLEAQSVQNLIEARDSLSRFDVPLFHTDQWHQLVLQESQLI